METYTFLQLAILILSVSLFISLQKLPKKALTKFRSKNRSTAESHRHFIQSAQLLSRARSNRNRAASHKLAKDAVAEADTAISINPKDAAAHIVKALALDLIGHKSSALRSLDTALAPPAGKSLGDKERADALFKRAELQVGLNRRRRVDSAVLDLIESVRLSPENGKGFCLLGECYEVKGMVEEARRAFLQALKIEPSLISAQEGLARVGPLDLFAGFEN